MSYTRTKKITSLSRGDTNTTLFLVPILELKIEYLKHEHGFINGFIADVDVPNEDYMIYLLFAPKDVRKLYHFFNREHGRTNYFINTYNYGDYIVAKYEFPEKWRKEWDLFLEGKYSQFRKKFVDLLPQEEHKEDKFGPFTEPSIQYHICNQTRLLKNYWERELDVRLGRDTEYWSAPDMTIEILDIEKIKNDSRTNKEHLGELSESEG